MKLIWDILKGAVIGLANIIPGVSGGTMMVSMGIYDTLISCITHLFKQPKKSLKTLAPFAVGMVLAIVGLSFVIDWAFTNYPLPTNTLFIGLILGGLPAILKNLKGSRVKVSGWALFILFFALIIFLQVIQAENVATIQLSVLEIVKLLLIGGMASATMVIPGVSGSMLLKLIGYYEPGHYCFVAVDGRSDKSKGLTMAQLSELMLEEISPRDSLRASKEFRTSVAPVVLHRTIRLAAGLEEDELC